LPQNANRSVSAITEMYVQERYGRGPEEPGEVEQHASRADKAWQRTRENILGKWARRVIPFGGMIWPERK
ncbi:MAG: hypothetical protein AAF125_16885, partial [Chloroflexota bacterium]